MKKKILVGLGALASVLVLLIVLIVVTVKPDELIARHQAEASRLASEKLGRELTLGEIESFFWPQLGARVRSVRLAGPAGQDQPQVSLGELEIDISLWRAVVSLGKELVVEAVVLRDLDVRLARNAEGVWDFDDILKHLEESQPAAEQPDEPEGPRDLSFLEGARIERVALERAHITIDDAALGRPLSVDKLDVELKDIALGQPIRVTVRTDLVDGSSRTPVELDATLSELRKDLSFDPVPDITARARVQNLDVAPWGQLVPAGAMAPAAGLVDVDLQATATAGLTHFTAQGKANLGEVVLRQGKVRGAPLTLAIQVNADVDTKAPRYAVEELAVQGTGIDLSGHAFAHGLSPTGLEKADLSLAVNDLARVVAVVPSSAPLLPSELTLAGPIAAHVKGNASAVDLAVNLDKAHVAWADAFDKKAGRALNLSLKGEQAGGRLDIPAFALHVDSARFGGKLSLPTDGKGPITADLTSGPVEIASLKELLPPVAKALGQGKKVDGRFELVAAAKVVGDAQDAKATVKLSGLDVQLEGLQAKGAGTVEASVRPAPAGGGGPTSLQARVELDGLALSSKGADGEKQLDKPAGMPLRLSIDVDQTPKAAQVKEALLVIGKTEVTAKGGATGLDTEAPVLDLDFGRVDVQFDDVRRCVPGAGDLPAGGHLRGAVKVGGAPSALSTLAIDAKGLDLAFGKTKIEGQAAVKNLDAPVLDVKLPRVAIAFDDLRPFAREAMADVPKGGRFRGNLELAADTQKLATLDVKTRVDELLYDNATLSGTLGLKNLDEPTFAFDLKSPALDLDRLLGTDEGEQKPAKKGKAKPKAQEPVKDEDKEIANPHGLPHAVRKELAKVSGTGHLVVGKTRFSGLDMKDFDGKLVMKRGVVTFEALDFTLYGGRISGKGTKLDLAATHTGYDLKVAAKHLDLASALAAHTDVKGVFDGRVDQTIEVSGRGLTKKDLISSLAGHVGLRTDDLVFKTLDVLGPVGEPLKAALETAGYQRVTGKKFKGLDAGKNGTTLKDVSMLLKFGDGGFKIDKPVDVKTPFGKLNLNGGAGLDEQLAFTATALIEPGIINQALGAQALKAPVAVPLSIGGTWKKPKVTGVDARALIKSVMESGVLGELGEAAQRAQEEAERLAAEAQAQAEKAKAEAEKRAREAQERAQAEAEKVKKEAEKKAAEAKKVAEQQAAAAKKKAEEEAAAAKKKAEDAKKKAEEEAKKKAAEAKKKAEEEAKKQAAAAKKKAEEEAKKKAKGGAKKIGDALGL